jgi:ferredoxin
MSEAEGIEVDHDKCVGSRLCVAVAPKVFVLNDDGQAEVGDPQGDTPENIRIAAGACPMSAITLKQSD